MWHLRQSMHVSGSITANLLFSKSSKKRRRTRRYCHAKTIV
uniref:Uncharacterized protein n=1 Tax=Rhizophora mucronata TaxID=61149 RepID=A0A2P2P4D4_RHIMU